MALDRIDCKVKNLDAAQALAWLSERRNRSRSAAEDEAPNDRLLAKGGEGADAPNFLVRMTRATAAVGLAMSFCIATHAAEPDHASWQLSATQTITRDAGSRLPPTARTAGARGLRSILPEEVSNFSIEAMHVSTQYLAELKEREGLLLAGYLDSNGNWTIGYGHKGTMPDGAPINAHSHITEARARQVLLNDVAEMERSVQRLVDVPVTQSQFDALVDFAFNKGPGRLTRSTLLAQLNRADYFGTAEGFLKWKKGGMAGRANAERETFMRDFSPDSAKALADLHTRVRDTDEDIQEATHTLSHLTFHRHDLSPIALTKALENTETLMQAMHLRAKAQANGITRLVIEHERVVHRAKVALSGNDPRGALARAREAQVLKSTIARVQVDVRETQEQIRESRELHKLLAKSVEAVANPDARSHQDPAVLMEIAHGWSAKAQIAKEAGAEGGATLMGSSHESDVDGPGAILLPPKSIERIASAFNAYAGRAMTETKSSAAEEGPADLARFVAPR